MTRTEILEFAAWLAATNRVFYGERVVVVADESDSMTKGGLHIPDQAQTIQKRGTVVALGLGIAELVKDIAQVQTADEESTVAGLAVGDRIIHNTYNVLTLQIPDAEGNPVKVFVFHAADIYVGWQLSDIVNTEIVVLEPE